MFDGPKGLLTGRVRAAGRGGLFAAVAALGLAFAPSGSRPAAAPRLPIVGASHYQVVAVRGGFSLRGARHGLDAFFSGRGAEVSAGAAELGLRLGGYGYGAVLRHVGGMSPVKRGGTIFYQRGAVTESYTSEPGGIEQRFALSAPPASTGSGPLSLALTLSGNVRAERSGGTIRFTRGASSLLYRGLLAVDARGRRLPAWIRLDRHSVSLEIDDRKAAYPLRIDPMIQASLTAPYPSSVLADHPTAYYRFDETSGLTGFDSSGNGLDGTYVTGTQLGVAGALLSESDPGVGAPGRGLVFHQSGDQLPDGDKARTLEAWLNYGCCNAAFTLMQYGDVAGGNGFSVSIGDSGGSIAVSAGTATVSAPTIGDFAHGWHMVDVSYDGNNVEIYEDGQIIGGGQLGTLATAVPGQGFQVGANTGGMGLDEVAVYPAALTPERIDAHWSAGGNDLGIAACATAPTTPYAQAILTDQPLAYYRLGELSYQGRRPCRVRFLAELRKRAPTLIIQPPRRVLCRAIQMRPRARVHAASHCRRAATRCPRARALVLLRRGLTMAAATARSP